VEAADTARSFTVAAASLTYELTRGAWSSGLTIGLVVIAACALGAFVVVELRRRDPMLDLSLLRNPARGGQWRYQASFSSG
jgi:hypothetical protein